MSSNPSKPGKLQGLFNYLSERPKHSWTLNGLIFGESSRSEFDFNILKAWGLSRGARIAERTVTLSGIFAAAAYAATAAAPMVAIPVALGIAAVSKIAGLAAGGGVTLGLKAVGKKFKLS